MNTIQGLSRWAQAGRILLSLATLMYGAVPPFMDLTKTHVIHAEWIPHARFHLVWQVATNSIVALLALFFLWFWRGNQLFALDLAGVLGLAVLGGFYVSMFTRSWYGGALSEPGVVPPLNSIDANLFGFTVALAFLLVGLGLVHVPRMVHHASYLKLSRRFGWSTLLGLATVPTYVLIVLPILATVADFLGLFGARLPLRTQLGVAGALVLLLASLLIRSVCPKTIVCTQSLRQLEEKGGMARLKNVWREELNKRIDNVGLRDAVRTVRPLLKPPHAKNTQDIDDHASLNQVLHVIDQAEFVDLGRVSEAARSNFEHLGKFWQVGFAMLLLLGWLLSASSIILAALAVFRIKEAI